MTTPLRKPHALPTRDTLVLEITLSKALGTTAESHHITADVLRSLGDLLSARSLDTPQTHISPTYGMSGVLPMEMGYGLHLYAWDHENQLYPPFLSLDVAAPEAFPIDLQHRLRDGLGNLFKIKPEYIMMKSRRQPEISPWKDLAPHITRQRLAIDGMLNHPISQDKLAGFLNELPNVLNMTDLSGPVFFTEPGEKSALTFWGHWETSGYLGQRHETQFGMDIYTCKAFDPEVAIRFVRERLKLHIQFAQEF